MQTLGAAAVDLYWIPLGAGGHYVRFNGRVFEAIEAAFERRPRCDLYHAALVVDVDGDRYTIELAPSPDAEEATRGVVATGAVGSRRLDRWRLFRYEVRCWRGGSIPDLRYAAGGFHRLTGDPEIARRVLDLAATVPGLVWGRDELGTGEMWNSNSVIAWLLAAAGLPAGLLRPPATGRAPGWQAGIAVAGGVATKAGERPPPRTGSTSVWPFTAEVDGDRAFSVRTRPAADRALERADAAARARRGPYAGGLSPRRRRTRPAARTFGADGRGLPERQAGAHDRTSG